MIKILIKIFMFKKKYSMIIEYLKKWKIIISFEKKNFKSN